MIHLADLQSRLFAYFRAAGAGEGAEQELAAIQHYAGKHVADAGDGKIRLFRDAGQQTHRQNLAAREQGGRLFDWVRAGDHVVFLSLTKRFHRRHAALI